MKKTEYILSLISGVEAQASNFAPANRLKSALAPLKERMQHKKALGLDPDETKAAEQIAAAKSAVAAYNAAVAITLPDDADILAGLDAAEADTPNEFGVTPEPEPAPEPEA